MKKNVTIGRKDSAKPTVETEKLPPKQSQRPVEDKKGPKKGK